MTTPTIAALQVTAGQLAAAVKDWHDGADTAAAAAAPAPHEAPPATAG